MLVVLLYCGSDIVEMVMLSTIQLMLFLAIFFILIIKSIRNLRLSLVLRYWITVVLEMIRNPGSQEKRKYLAVSYCQLITNEDF